MGESVSTKDLQPIVTHARETLEAAKKGVPEGIDMDECRDRMLSVLNDLESLIDLPKSRFEKDKDGQWKLEG